MPSEVHGKEEVDGSSPSEGFTKASKWPFLLPQRRAPIARSSLNLSPRSVPNISGGLNSWLEQGRLTASSTSVVGRCPLPNDRLAPLPNLPQARNQITLRARGGARASASVTTADCSAEDGAFIEPRGCNRWQSAASHAVARTAEISQNRCRELRPIAVRSTW